MRPRGTTTEAIKEMLRKFPALPPLEIQRRLNLAGVQTTRGYVTAIRAKLKASGEITAQQIIAAGLNGHADASASDLTVADLTIVAAAITSLRGRNRLRAAIDVLASLGNNLE
jgi:hypothetical protein